MSSDNNTRQKSTLAEKEDLKENAFRRRPHLHHS